MSDQRGPPSLVMLSRFSLHLMVATFSLTFKLRFLVEKLLFVFFSLSFLTPGLCPGALIHANQEYLCSHFLDVSLGPPKNPEGPRAWGLFVEFSCFSSSPASPRYRKSSLRALAWNLSSPPPCSRVNHRDSRTAGPRFVKLSTGFIRGWLFPSFFFLHRVALFPDPSL